MKKIYWRPSKVPRIILVVISVFAVAGMLSVELIKTENKQPYYTEKIQAAQTMKKGMDVIRRYHLRIVGAVDKDVDPADSGIIGVPASEITTNFGYLPAKQTTANPNWAAVMVEMFKEAGVKEGDVVAMGFSGSFPAMNLAAYAAIKELKAEAIVISAASASTWGSNHPLFTWLDMERILIKEGVIEKGSVAASLGGEGDRALGTTKQARQALRSAVERNQLPLINDGSMAENIAARMDIYQKHARGQEITTYVNIGGSMASVGPRTGKKSYEPGVNRRYSPAALKYDSVTTRFAKQGVPIIHIYRINDLAERYGLPKSPKTIPNVGEGNIYTRLEYNLYLLVVNLVLLLAVSHLFLRLDLGYRIFASRRNPEAPNHPQPMV